MYLDQQTKTKKKTDSVCRHFESNNKKILNIYFIIPKYFLIKIQILNVTTQLF